MFGLQDRVTEGVVKAILPSIRGAEIERVRRKRPEDLDVHDLTLRAFPFLFAANPHCTRQALDLLHRAMRIDPDFALSTALAAFGHAQFAVHNGTPAPSEEKKGALQLAKRAAILDPDDSQVLTARCAVHHDRTSWVGLQTGWVTSGCQRETDTVHEAKARKPWGLDGGKIPCRALFVSGAKATA